MFLYNLYISLHVSKTDQKVKKKEIENKNVNSIKKPFYKL